MEDRFLMENESRAITVTELNTLVHDVLEGCDIFSHISVRGEISNFVHHRSGHLYFSLKDEGGLVRAVMFRSAASRLTFVPENGMKVVVTASLTTYVKDGQYQLMVTSMEPDGVGALYLAFERLKKKLAAEGLFDEARKKPLPKVPTRIGIITSPTGAALRDMLNILKRRFPLAQVLL
ncbi:MAG: exodeoxyribonuclease VII large subunit [Clostridia bacterium]|nr:exodeoxyribonuclease VII large subunit [Clostridia bacterium]